MPERLRPGKTQVEAQGKKSGSAEQQGKGWKPSTEFYEFLLSEPDVTLFADNTPDSTKMFEILDSEGIHFKIDKTDKRKTPYIRWGTRFDDKKMMGPRHKGVEGAEFLVRLFSKMSEAHLKAALKRDPQEFEGGDPEFMKWMEEMEERRRERNYEIMYGEGVKPKEKPHRRL